MIIIDIIIISWLWLLLILLDKQNRAYLKLSQSNKFIGRKSCNYCMQND